MGLREGCPVLRARRFQWVETLNNLPTSALARLLAQALVEWMQIKEALNGDGATEAQTKASG